MCALGAEVGRQSPGDELHHEQHAAAEGGVRPSERGEHAQPGAEGDSESCKAPATAAVEVLVSTDVCLRALEGRGSPLGLPLLVNYDFPSRKVRI